MRVTLCLLCVSVCLAGVRGAPLRAAKKTEENAASLEEVNVLMFGVLQFSESLHHIYQTTEAKIDSITNSLRGHEVTLQRLGQEAVQAVVVEDQIKGVLSLLQAQMVSLQAQTEQTKGKLAHVEQDEEEMRKQVNNLETNLKNSTPPRIKELQERAAKHSNILMSLKRWNKTQKHNLELQNQKLTKLQRRIGGG